MAVVAAMYSASHEDNATVFCFIEPQHMMDEPMIKTYPEVLIRSSISPAKSLSLCTVDLCGLTDGELGANLHKLSLSRFPTSFFPFFRTSASFPLKIPSWPSNSLRLPLVLPHSLLPVPSCSSRLHPPSPSFIKFLYS